MNNQDARPFVDLKKDAKEFRETFEEDIQECINYLDSSITALICDPDSLGYPEKKLQQNALVEFSKAKYDIFLGVKSLINKKEVEWKNYMSEMRKLFIENVEIFLAGTKLEVKLPSSEYESSPGSRKSPGNRKSYSSVTSSIYPIMNKITKSIPAGDNVQSNSNSRLSIKLNKPAGNVSVIYHDDTVDSSEDSENETRPVRNRFQSKLDRSLTRANKLASRKEESEDDSEMDTEPEIVKNTAPRTPSIGARVRRRAAEVEEVVTEIQEAVKKLAPQKPSVGARGRRRAAEVEEFVTEIQEADEFTPIARPTKSIARRKTMLPNFEDPSGSDIIPANPTRAKSKRKTICGVAEMESAAPSKRLKVGNKRGKTPAQEEDNEADDNLLESDDDYSEWMPLKSIDGKIPTGPAIYEVKVWRAKKPAYIGSCDSLRQKLTLYKLKQNSGHKHLDKFVDRNYDDIQIRYETVASADDAKQDVKDRIKSFVAQFKTTPAYN